MGHQGPQIEGQDLNKEFAFLREAFFFWAETQRAQLQRRRWVYGVRVTGGASRSVCRFTVQSCVCVFLSSRSDTGRPFLEMHSEIPEIVNMTEGKEVIIPCRVSSPNISVTLKKVKLGSAPLPGVYCRA